MAEVSLVTNAPLVLRNNGVTISVRKGGKQLGDIIIGKGKVTVFRKGAKKPTRVIPWESLFESLAADPK